MNNLIFSDPAMKEEFLDRFPELAGSGGAGGGGGGALEGIGGALESLGGGFENLPFSMSDAEAAVKSMQEGTGAPVDAGLEAIIKRFGRPAYFVKDKSFDTANAKSSSESVNKVVNDAKGLIDKAIPSVGRINLRSHPKNWVGTGWVVAKNVLVTNRHVAREFAETKDGGFVFIESADGRRARAELDTFRELGSGQESVFRLKRVLWIAPSGAHDMAFLSIEDEDQNGDPQPPPIDLIDQAGFDAVPVKEWASVIGYPAFSIWNDAQDQQRIFEGIYNVKRMQPGLVVAKGANGIVNHDATTLGGNSGSVVLDLTSGKALALHYGGLEGDTNNAVAAPIVADALKTKVGPLAS